jgi:hypothetical protein
MPQTFICLDVSIKRKKVGGGAGMFMQIDNEDSRTCRDLMNMFLQAKATNDVEAVLHEDTYSTYS